MGTTPTELKVERELRDSVSGVQVRTALGSSSSAGRGVDRGGSGGRGVGANTIPMTGGRDAGQQATSVAIPPPVLPSRKTAPDVLLVHRDESSRNLLALKLSPYEAREAYLASALSLPLDILSQTDSPRGTDLGGKSSSTLGDETGRKTGSRGDRSNSSVVSSQPSMRRLRSLLGLSQEDVDQPRSATDVPAASEKRVEPIPVVTVSSPKDAQVAAGHSSSGHGSKGKEVLRDVSRNGVY